MNSLATLNVLVKLLKAGVVKEKLEIEEQEKQNETIIL